LHKEFVLGNMKIEVAMRKYIVRMLTCTWAEHRIWCEHRV